MAKLDENAAFTGTMPVQPRHAFDAARLEAWMREHVADFRGPLEVEQFKGGQSNPTFRLRSPSGLYVLRRKPPGKLLPSAHAVDREFRVISALAGTGVPVARARALCEDDAVIGSAFYIMDCVEGRIFWDQTLPGLGNDERAAIYDAMNEAIAKLHLVDYRAVGLAEFGRPGNYFARQIGRWSKQYQASETEKIEAMDRLIAWLPERIPAEEETGIVHGDYRMDNIIFDAREPRVLAVLDWELSTLGDPLGDFAYHAMGWRLEPTLFRGIGGVELAPLGIPSEEEYVAAYCRRTGRAGIPHWEFYIVYSMFRIAAILQGIMKRSVDGTASSEQAVDMGRRARPIGERAWALARRMGG